MKQIPSPDQGQILLLVTPYVGGRDVFDLVARLALLGSLEVVDGGNTFDAYHVVAALRRQTADYSAALDRIRLARAFTCYQMAALLADLESTPRPGVPLLALDFLSTFADQNVATAARRRLLKECLACLRRSSAQAPLGVWVRVRTVAPPEMEEFLARIQHAAGQVWRLDHLPPAVPLQLGLF
jgi:hypothetical protein